MDEQVRLMEKLSAALEKSQQLQDELIDVEMIRECDDRAISYDLFYCFAHSSHVKEYELVGEATVEDIFGYVIRMTLEDNSEISFIVDVASFDHAFLSEDVIFVDTQKTIDRLAELIDKQCDSVLVQIKAPECVNPKKGEFLPRRIELTGMFEDGVAQYTTEPVEEIASDLEE